MEIVDLYNRDTFNVKGIPEKYRKNGMFTITNIEHNIDGMF